MSVLCVSTKKHLGPCRAEHWHSCPRHIFGSGGRASFLQLGPRLSVPGWSGHHPELGTAQLAQSELPMALHQGTLPSTPPC